MLSTAHAPHPKSRRLTDPQVPGTSKLEKRLEEVAHLWDDIKAAQPLVKSAVEPIQVGAEAART